MRAMLVFVSVLAFCGISQNAVAQGLLGKGSLSGQYLLVKFSENEIPNFDGIDHGGRLLFSVPLTMNTSEESAAFGIDWFVNGYGYILSDQVGFASDMHWRLTNAGVETGATAFMNFAETFKPFVQLGVQVSRLTSKITDSSGGVLLSDSVNDTSLIFGAGIEWTFLPSYAALQSSVVFGSEMLGNTEFRNDLIIRPGDSHWFGRLSAIANTDSDVFVGFGGGFTW